MEWIVLAIIVGVVLGLMRRRQKRLVDKVRLRYVEVLDRPRSRPPRRRGLSPAEKEVEQRRYIRELRERGQISFRRTAWQAGQVGSRHYVWLSAGDSDVCSTCAAKNGRRFVWGARLKGGHPGDGSLCTQGYCRCTALPVVPKM